MRDPLILNRLTDEAHLVCLDPLDILKTIRKRRPAIGTRRKIILATGETKQKGWRQTLSIDFLTMYLVTVTLSFCPNL